MRKEIYSVQKAKGELSYLLEKVASGAEVIIAREGRPLARISRIEESQGVSFGVPAGGTRVVDDFDAPWADELMSAFESKAEGRYRY
jgi:prevent-host-death family protein